MANSALTAIIASLSVISIYIAVRFEWKFAVPVLIALMHDILITAGVYALIGREVTTSTVAALLTILGFSLYDTIIVFDRIRENVPRMPSAAFSQIVNRSMSEVIVRSLATSFCTVLPVLALFLFGGDTLQDFAFALIIGTLSGAYSSVFIAGPVLVHWKEREPVYRSRASADQASSSATCPRTRSRRPARRSTSSPSASVARRRSVTAPQDPTQVSREEFDDMVRNLGVDDSVDAQAGGRRRGPPRRRAARARARRGRRGAARGSAAGRRAEGAGRRADAEEATQPPPREAALMGALVWVMMGLAIWHFAIFVPDRFWSGIVGAFLGALIGSVVFGFAVNGFTVPGQNDTDLINALEAIPGAIAGMAVVYFIGLRDAAAGRSMPVRVCAMRWRAR